MDPEERIKSIEKAFDMLPDDQRAELIKKMRVEIDNMLSIFTKRGGTRK